MLVEYPARIDRAGVVMVTLLKRTTMFFGRSRDMKTIRVGRRQISLVGPSETDHYFSALSHGADDVFDHLCERFLRPDSVALDIGANIGVTSAILSQHLSEGYIFAFEPGASIFRALQTNIETNRLTNVKAFNMAVAETSGAVLFSENSAYGSISKSGTETRSTSVDDIAADLKRLDFIKIDVEGFEKNVLLGAKETISKFNPVIYMEYNPWCQLVNSRTSPFEFAEWILDNFKYLFAVIPGEAPRLKEYPKQSAGQILYDNIVTGTTGVDDFIITNNDAAANVCRSLVDMATATSS